MLARTCSGISRCWRRGWSPAGSLYHRGPHQCGIASDFAECVPDHWIEVRVRQSSTNRSTPQRDGYGLLLLPLERQDEEEDAEERELEESYRAGFKSKKRRP